MPEDLHLCSVETLRGHRADHRLDDVLPCLPDGLSGNGKTTMVDQVCAQDKRNVPREHHEIQTDEDDLLGGFRVNGDTVWQDGRS